MHISHVEIYGLYQMGNHLCVKVKLYHSLSLDRSFIHTVHALIAFPIPTQCLPLPSASNPPAKHSS